ncbi:unnamed protein product [Nippostrongylus brasiliensis]|uniref:Uncharacterized protein n=1 Tax=Nippostrongylus brasiliensis TaxID=27835 RepID=A0A0N4YIN8_NIPBR|nr:hypothetical protein Q1695_005142 [Nippostrongylus brasiliensis]VDL80384.1 unnamed protein product [Nippostrongylus brasiliensis]
MKIKGQPQRTPEATNPHCTACDQPPEEHDDFLSHVPPEIRAKQVVLRVFTMKSSPHEHYSAMSRAMDVACFATRQCLMYFVILATKIMAQLPWQIEALAREVADN